MSDISNQNNATLSAFFEHRHDADKAVDRLIEAGIPQSAVRLLPGNESDAPVADREASHRGFFGALADFFMPNEDRYAYAEGLTRGGYLVTVSDLDNTSYERALDILDDEGAVDFDQVEESWRSEGWSGLGTGGDSSRTADTQPLGTATYNSSAAAPSPARIQAGDDINPVTQQNLQLSKRDVNLGRPRVRSYRREDSVSAGQDTFNDSVSKTDVEVEDQRRDLDQQRTNR